MACVESAVVAPARERFPHCPDKPLPYQQPSILKPEERAFTPPMQYHIAKQRRHWTKLIVCPAQVDQDTFPKGVGLRRLDPDRHELRIARVIDSYIALNQMARWVKPLSWSDNLAHPKKTKEAGSSCRPTALLHLWHSSTPARSSSIPPASLMR